uniref:Uncharacterized protein n=1 Tax=Lepeophtheirus salmonis TaxID=72036 RepID=A0A0K2U323_LEPSM
MGLIPSDPLKYEHLLLQCLKNLSSLAYIQVEKMILEKDQQISIRTLQAVGRLQNHCLCRQQVQNDGEEEHIFQKGQTRSWGVKENSPGQSPQVNAGQCKISQDFTPDCL